MYLAGVSVRWGDDITQALWGTRVSPSVSKLNQKIRAIRAGFVADGPRHLFTGLTTHLQAGGKCGAPAMSALCRPSIRKPVEDHPL